MNKIQRILEFVMRMEKDASDFYTYYMDKVQAESTRDLFRELAEIEKYHYHLLKSKYDELGYTHPPISISWVVDNNFTARDPHILANNADIVGEADGALSDLTILRMAYLIENDFALFYKNAAQLVEEPEVKAFLSSLWEWEEQHKKLFHERYQELLKKHWSDLSSILFA